MPVYEVPYCVSVKGVNSRLPPYPLTIQNTWPLNEVNDWKNVADGDTILQEKCGIELNANQCYVQACPQEPAYAELVQEPVYTDVLNTLPNDAYGTGNQNANTTMRLPDHPPNN